MFRAQNICAIHVAVCCVLYGILFNMIVGAKWILFIWRLITFSASVVVACRSFLFDFRAHFSITHTRRTFLVRSLWLYSVQYHLMECVNIFIWKIWQKHSMLKRSLNSLCVYHQLVQSIRKFLVITCLIDNLWFYAFDDVEMMMTMLRSTEEQAVWYTYPYII